MELKFRANAKINLFLDILGKLPNGFHSLFMLMQSVSLYDEVSVKDNNLGEIRLTCSEKALPTDRKNIAYKAAEVFFEYTGIENQGVDIHIEKNIPFEAGLAGGSADAAGVIVALNKLFKTDLSEHELHTIGLKIGSDVPFCISGGTMLSQNTGGVLSTLPNLKDCFVVLAKPASGVSTARAYSDFDSAGYIYRPNNMNMLAAAADGDFDSICKLACNVFEQTIEVPERVEIKQHMNDFDCSLTQMSGSGPTVFGLFLDEEKATACYEKLKSSKLCKSVHLAHTAKQGVEEITK